MAGLVRIPALAIQKGAAVVVTPAGTDPVEDESGQRIPPVEVVRQLLRGDKTVLLMDLDALAGREPQWKLLKELCGLGACWVMAGAPPSDGVMYLLTAGADAVVLTTRTVPGFRAVFEAAEVSDRVVFGIDIDRDGRTVLGDAPDLRGPAAGLAARAIDAGAAMLLVAFTPSGPLDAWGTETIRAVSSLGPTYVDGVPPNGRDGLSGLGATGVIADLLEILAPVDAGG